MDSDRTPPPALGQTLVSRGVLSDAELERAPANDGDGPFPLRSLSARVDVTREAAEHDRIAALQRRLEQLDRIIESLGAALQRSTEELERLRVELGERDAIIETLRRRSGDADGDTGIGSVHSLVRAAGRARH